MLKRAQIPLKKLIFLKQENFKSFQKMKIYRYCYNFNKLYQQLLRLKSLILLLFKKKKIVFFKISRFKSPIIQVKIEIITLKKNQIIKKIRSKKIEIRKRVSFMHCSRHKLKTEVGWGSTCVILGGIKSCRASFLPGLNLITRVPGIRHFKSSSNNFP